MKTRILLALLIAIAAPSVAIAGPSAADRDRAVALAQGGQDALDKQDFATALDKFSQADQIIHAPTLQVGAARAEVGLHRLLAAEARYKRILAEGNPDPKKQVFVDALNDAKKELDALTPRIPTISISIKGAAAASITLDGAAVDPAAASGKTPVDPGPHHVHAASAAGTSQDVDVSVNEGENKPATLDLTPGAPPPPPPPTTPTPQSSGGSGQRIAGIALIAVGGVGLIVGAATGGLAVKKHGDLVAECPGKTCTTSAANSDLSSYHTVGIVASVGVGVGVAAAGAGLIVFLTAPKAKAATTAATGPHIAPVIGLGYAGVDGTF